MHVREQKLEKTIIAIIAVGFIVWGAGFIYRSSFIAIDGNRYFSLFDDDMVSMRYAWNFSHGLGLVWNPGERVEGYTNLLMTLFMALATLIFNKSAAVLFIQISGVGLMLVIAYLSMQIAGHVVRQESYPHQTLAKVLVFFGALAYYPLAYWSLMGMETGLLTALLLLSILSAFNYTRSRKTKFLFLAAASLGLAYLTRNDSIIFALLIWLCIVWENPNLRTKHKALYPLMAAIGLFSLMVIGQVAFRDLYYGELLPNTYTLKLLGMPLATRIENGIGFVTPFLIEIAILLVLSSVDLIFNFRMRKLLFYSILLSAIGYQIYIGGDSWNYWRISAPTIPLLIILSVSAVNTVAHALAGGRTLPGYSFQSAISRRKHAAELLAISATLAGLLFTNMRFMPQIFLLQQPYQVEQNKRNVNTAIALTQVTTVDASVGVIWGGVVPYYTGRKAIDFLGKSDKYVAHLPPDLSGDIARYGMTSVPGHNKYDLRYSIKKLLPTYVEAFSYGHQDLTQWAQSRYVTVQYGGINLSLLRDSPAVLWDKLDVR
jgi:arabinofuranosyltransferase